MKTEGVWREKDYKHMFMRTAALMEKLADGTVAELQLSGKRDYDAIFQRQSVIFASQMFEVALRMVKERSHELFLQPKKDDPKNLYQVIGNAPNPNFFFERSPYLMWESLHLADRLDPSEVCKSDTRKVLLGNQQDTSRMEEMEDDMRNLESQMASLKKTLASKERETSIVKQQNQAHKILLAKQEVLLAALSSKLGPDAASEILEKAERPATPRKVDAPAHRAARQQRAKAAAAAREGTSSKESTPDAETEPKKTEPKKAEQKKPEPKPVSPPVQKAQPKPQVQSPFPPGPNKIAPANMASVPATPKATPAPTPVKAAPAPTPAKATPATPVKATPATQVKATLVAKATPPQSVGAKPAPAAKNAVKASPPAQADPAAEEGERVIAAATQALQDYRELWAKGAPCLTLPPHVLEGAKNGDISAIVELTAAVDDLKARHEFEQDQKKKNPSAKTSTLNEVLASRQGTTKPAEKAATPAKAPATPAKAAPAKAATPAKATPAATPAAKAAPKKAFIMNYPGVPMPADVGGIATSLGHAAPASVNVTQPPTQPVVSKSTASYSMSHMSDFEMSLDSVNFANDRIPHKSVFVMTRFAKHLPVDVMVQEVYNRCGPTSKEFLLTCRADDDDWECVFDCLKGFVDRQTPIPFPAYVQDISQ